jgi:hypothetical protein
MLPVNFIDYDQMEYVKTPTYEKLVTNKLDLMKNIIVLRLNYRFAKGKTTRKTKKDIDIETPDDGNKLF